MIFGMLEMSIRCPRCDSPVHVNGPAKTLLCGSCQSEIDVPEDYWKGILEDVCTDVRSDLEEGEGTSSTIFGTFNTSLLYGRLKPYCPKCKTDLPVDEQADAPSVCACPECGGEVRVEPAPAWLRGLVPSARLLVNAEVAPGGGGEHDEPAVSGPVAFFCPQCGGSLMIDGRERLVPCNYCETSVYLPDDLWLRLHPARTKQRWFLGLA